MEHTDVMETQMLMMGLTLKTTCPGMDTFMKMEALLHDPVKLSDVMKKGSIFVDSQRDRLLNQCKSAKRITLTHGASAMVLESPDFVELAHDVLHTEYKEVDVSMVISTLFHGLEEGHIYFQYSLKSYNPLYSAETLVRPHGGSGNARFAEGTLKIESGTKLFF
jgi:hypothetical protein